jgi:protocatechuate 3,4-dioxygenase beta subunit
MVIDFDLGKSFVLRGNSINNNGLLFKPVVRGVARDITGGVSGIVHASTATGAGVANASVEILKAGSAITDTVSADVIATAKTDSTGAYSVQFLLPATYAVRATPPSGSALHPALVPSVVVATGKTTTGTDLVLQ